MGGLPMLPFLKNLVFASVDLLQVAARKDFADLLSAIMGMAQRGDITPPQPIHTFKASEIVEAIRFMQTRKHIRKIVIDFFDDDVVLVQPLAKSSLFDASATYVIAGGFGGVGRSISKWMVENGARNLILLSRPRPGGHGESRQAFVEELRARGTNIAAPLCDIGDLEDLQTALDECCAKMPPVKGCIQSAMVLQVYGHAYFAIHSSLIH